MGFSISTTILPLMHFPKTDFSKQLLINVIFFSIKLVIPGLLLYCVINTYVHDYFVYLFEFLWVGNMTFKCTE